MKRKKIVCLFALLIASMLCYSQKLENSLYNKSLRQIEEKNYEGALKTLTQYLKFFSVSEKATQALCNRAFVFSELNQLDEAVDDYGSAFKRDTFNAEPLLLKAKMLYKLKKYNTALREFSHSLLVDSTLDESYYLKAKIYKQQTEEQLYCAYLQKAIKFGSYDALKESKMNCDTNSKTIQRCELKILDSKARDSDYGFSDYKPIKLGGNDRNRISQFFNLLVDENGNRVHYIAKSSCCPYKSRHGVFGKAVCETYEVMLNEEKRTMFFSFADYEEPKIPVGFKRSLEIK